MCRWGPTSPRGRRLARVGPVWAYLLIAMHATLELTTNLGWWGPVMIASLLSFVPAARLEALIARFRA